MAHVREIELPGGAVVLARVSTAGGYAADDDDVGVIENAVAKVERLGELIAGVGRSVLDAAAAVRPDEASISFGIELSAKAGAAVAILADGEAKSSIQVTLTWRLEDQPAPPVPPPPPNPPIAPPAPGGSPDA
ncbi:MULTISPECIES: CU044_2847 family protein [unclassified Streptomyces]|uniref:Trypsin-co-occurring domain-containing protein n=1 Tax=Streptomyces sp. NBC_00060 TaxID=2975636 RepID=A0AAU2H081_9ACTN